MRLRNGCKDQKNAPMAYSRGEGPRLSFAWPSPARLAFSNNWGGLLPKPSLLRKLRPVPTAPSIFPRLARPLLWLLFPLHIACGQVSPPAAPAVPEVAALPAPIVPDSLAWLHQRLDSSRVFRQHLVGVSLADVGTGQVVFGHHEGVYCTPASTMKLFSLYAGLALLPDSLPSLRWFSRGDTLFFQGTGDPTFLHGDVPSRRAYAFLAGRPEKMLAYCELPTPPAYGPSWAWDDYNYYFQPERTAFPVFGNTVRFYAAAPLPVARPRSGGVPALPMPLRVPQAVRVLPRFFAPLTGPAPADYRRSPDLDPTTHVRRAPLENHFMTLPWPRAYVDEVPYRTSRALLLKLLGDTLRRAIAGSAWHPRFERDSVRTLPGLPVDSLYGRMLRVSDNFLAEQLLLLCSTRVGFHDSLSGPRVIRQLLKNDLKTLPDPPVWVDGSGLSRLNLLTPRDMTALLLRLHQRVGEKRLLSLLAAGGGKGTLHYRYYEAGPPKTTWLWGKTGTLTHTCNLAGFVRCKSGRLLAVTFFNNNIYGDDMATRNKMELVLREVRARL